MRMELFWTRPSNRWDSEDLRNFGKTVQTNKQKDKIIFIFQFYIPPNYVFEGYLLLDRVAVFVEGCES